MARSHGSSKSGAPYVWLLGMVGLSFLVMYALMYAMVDRFANVFVNLNQAYMAGLMAAPMALVELAMMRSMYPDRRRNLAVVVGSVLLAGACWWGIRGQLGVGDRQFLRSMIPHHGGAILMCEQASVHSPEVRRLCREIVASQRTEIARMKALLSAPPP